MGTSVGKGRLTCVHIVKGIGYPVESLKEVVIINALTLWSNSVLMCDGFECRVHPPGSLYRCCTLGFLKKGEREEGVREGTGKREGRRGREGGEGEGEREGGREGEGWREGGGGRKEGRKGGMERRESRNEDGGKQGK